MVTLDGKHLSLDKPFELTPECVAMHLGRVVRFGGTVEGYWSVLQHSLTVSALARLRGMSAQVQLLALYHDAHEFITGDVPTPWKLKEVSSQQLEIDVAIRAAIGIPYGTHEDHLNVHLVDSIALCVEAEIVAPIVYKARPHAFKLKNRVHDDDRKIVRAFHYQLSQANECWWRHGHLVEIFAESTKRLLERVRESGPVGSRESA